MSDQTTPNTAASAEREALIKLVEEIANAAIRNYAMDRTDFNPPAWADRILALSPPPVEAGGVSKWSEARKLFVTYAERLNAATRYEEGSAIADKAGREFDALYGASLRTAPDPAGLVSDAVRDIAAERQRQVEVEGWTPEHDDAHGDFELSRAASGYAAMPWRRTEGRLLSPTAWPWSPEWWKPKDNRSDLVRAGALIVAEIERLDRAALTPAKGQTPT